MFIVAEIVSLKVSEDFLIIFYESMGANHPQVANLNPRVIDCKGLAGFT